MRGCPIVFVGLIFLGSAIFQGCTTATGNEGKFQNILPPSQEAQWIQNGDPLEFEGEYWYPQDDVEVLTDAEVSLIGNYQGVPFFVEKVDVRPYSRLLTKFSRNKFRVFEKQGYQLKTSYEANP